MVFGFFTFVLNLKIEKIVLVWDIQRFLIKFIRGNILNL